MKPIITFYTTTNGKYPTDGGPSFGSTLGECVNTFARLLDLSIPAYAGKGILRPAIIVTSRPFPGAKPTNRIVIC